MGKRIWGLHLHVPGNRTEEPGTNTVIRMHRIQTSNNRPVRLRVGDTLSPYLLIGLAIVVSTICGGPARAADIVWDGGPAGTGTNWLDAVNWAGDVVPRPQRQRHF